jgi:hypothetical protein
MFGIDVFEIAVEFRAMLAALLFIIVVNWSWDRVVGQQGDPTLSTSTFGVTGGLSVLVTGLHAVIAVTGLAVYLMWPTFAANPALLFIPVGLVMLHYYYEDVERSSSGLLRGDGGD